MCFGVKNELWGEEVAVAVVLKEGFTSEEQKERIKKDILDACRKNVKPSAIPVQTLFLTSMDQLPIGPTGKILRNNVGDHLDVRSVDTLLLNILEHPLSGEESATETSQVHTSNSLNGLRFLSACFVLQKHVGSYPNG